MSRREGLAGHLCLSNLHKGIKVGPGAAYEDLCGVGEAVVKGVAVHGEQDVVTEVEARQAMLQPPGEKAKDDERQDDNDRDEHPHWDLWDR